MKVASVWARKSQMGLAARTRRFGTLAAPLLLASWYTMTIAEARPTALRWGSRPAYFAYGMGSGIEMVESTSQFKMTQELGIHLGRGASGPALALSLAEAFGDEHVVFQIGPRFVWDIPLFRGVGFYLSPGGQLGYGMRAPSGGSAHHHLNMQATIDLKLLLANRLLLFFRPFGLDFYFVDDFWMRYDLLGGIGITF